jgi:hypothetical protein
MALSSLCLAWMLSNALVGQDPDVFRPDTLPTLVAKPTWLPQSLVRLRKANAHRRASTRWYRICRRQRRVSAAQAAARHVVRACAFLTFAYASLRGTSLLRLNILATIVSLQVCVALVLMGLLNASKPRGIRRWLGLVVLVANGCLLEVALAAVPICIGLVDSIRRGWLLVLSATGRGRSDKTEVDAGAEPNAGQVDCMDLPTCSGHVQPLMACEGSFVDVGYEFALCSAVL